MRLKNDEEKEITISEACKIFGRTRQGIFLSIQNKRLKAEKINGKWYVTRKSWKEYLDTRYRREFSCKDGKRIYDIEKGIISPSMALKILDIDKNHIYHCLRKGLIPFYKIGCSYVLNIKDILSNKEQICKRRKLSKICTGI